MAGAMQDVQTQISASQERNNKFLLTKIETLLSPQQPTRELTATPHRPSTQTSLSHITPDHQSQHYLSPPAEQSQLEIHGLSQTNDVIMYPVQAGNLDPPITTELNNNETHTNRGNAQRPQSRGTMWS